MSQTVSIYVTYKDHICSIVRLGFDPFVMLGIRVATLSFKIDSVCDSLIWQRLFLTYVQRLLSHLADDSNIKNEVFFSVIFQERIDG